MKVYAITFEFANDFSVEAICATKEIAERERLRIINKEYPNFKLRKDWATYYYIEEFEVIDE